MEEPWQKKLIGEKEPVHPKRSQGMNNKGKNTLREIQTGKKQVENGRLGAENIADKEKRETPAEKSKRI